jgi:hypothetical protein
VHHHNNSQLTGKLFLCLGGARRRLLPNPPLCFRVAVVFVAALSIALIALQLGVFQFVVQAQPDLCVAHFRELSHKSVQSSNSTQQRQELSSSQCCKKSPTPSRHEYLKTTPRSYSFHRCSGAFRVKPVSDLQRLSCEFSNFCVDFSGNWLYFEAPNSSFRNSMLQIFDKQQVGELWRDFRGLNLDLSGHEEPKHGYASEKVYQFAFDIRSSAELEMLTAEDAVLFRKGVYLLHSRVAMGNFGHGILNNVFPLLRLAEQFDPWWDRIRTNTKPLLMEKFCNSTAPEALKFAAGYPKCWEMTKALYELFFPRGYEHVGDTVAELSQHGPKKLACFERVQIGMRHFDALAQEHPTYNALQVDFFSRVRDYILHHPRIEDAVKRNIGDSIVILVHDKKRGRHAHRFANIGYVREFVREKLGDNFAGVPIDVQYITWTYEQEAIDQIRKVASADVYFSDSGSALYYSSFLAPGSAVITSAQCTSCRNCFPVINSNLQYAVDVKHINLPGNSGEHCCEYSLSRSEYEKEITNPAAVSWYAHTNADWIITESAIEAALQEALAFVYFFKGV